MLYAKVKNYKFCVFCRYWNGNANVKFNDLQKVLTYNPRVSGTCAKKGTSRSSENTCGEFALGYEFQRFV
jgi:hypothetical protein